MAAPSPTRANHPHPASQAPRTRTNLNKTAVRGKISFLLHREPSSAYPPKYLVRICCDWDFEEAPKEQPYLRKEETVCHQVLVSSLSTVSEKVVTSPGATHPCSSTQFISSAPTFTGNLPVKQSERSLISQTPDKKQRMQENSKKGGMSQDLFVKDAPTLPHLVLMDEVVPLQLFCKSTFT